MAKRKTLMDDIHEDLQGNQALNARFQRELTRLQAHPPRKVIFVTGTAGESESHRLVQETGLPLLRKPFNVAELLEQVRMTLGAP